MKVEITIVLRTAIPDEREYPGQQAEEYARHLGLALADSLTQGGDEARVAGITLHEQRRPEAHDGARDGARARAARVLYEAIINETETGHKPTFH